MPCRRRPTYPSKKEAARHGAITYGSGKHREYKVKSGWRTARRK